MKKIQSILLAASSLALFASPALASFGIFGDGVVLEINGTKTLYELMLAGDAKLIPSGFSPSIVTSSAGAFAAGTMNLGTFNAGNGDTLLFAGADILSYKSGENVFATHISFRIDGGTVTTIDLAFNQDAVGGITGDQRWYTQTGGQLTSEPNLLSGLATGTHQVEFWLDANSAAYDNNNNSNYKASFSVVPEPSSTALLLGSLLCGGSYLARRKRA